MSHLLAAASDDSVPLLELLLPLAAWVVLSVGVFVRSRRHPRKSSA